VFNNIFVQMDRVPGVAFVGMQQADNLREGGNLIWGIKEGPQLKMDPFAKFRATKLFTASRSRYEAGWTTHDQAADPKFVRLSQDGKAPDLRLQPGSPAINQGQPIPAAWPDPLREMDKDQPDSGALPEGAEAWGVGVDGRIPLFGG
jgi:hypothetical protein